MQVRGKKVQKQQTLYTTVLRQKAAEALITFKRSSFCIPRRTGSYIRKVTFLSY